MWFLKRVLFTITQSKFIIELKTKFHVSVDHHNSFLTKSVCDALTFIMILYCYKARNKVKILEVELSHRIGRELRLHTVDYYNILQK